MNLHRISRVLLGGLLASVLLTGCGTFLFANRFETSTPGPSPTLEITTTAAPMTTPTLPVNYNLLTVWIPPQFDPENGTALGNRLKNHLQLFEEENQPYKIDIRLKSATGPASLYESLQTAGAAAPMAMPALVALNRQDLESAALKGLIVPLNGFTTVLDETDWYDYSRNLAVIQNSWMGLPFAGDSLLIIYRPARMGQPFTNLEELLRNGQPVLFPAADPMASITLSLYMTTGARTQDDVGRPFLDLKALTQVLTFLDRANQLGIFQSNLNQYQTADQVWQMYREQGAQVMVGWSSQYLTELPADSNATPFYPLGTEAKNLATGWTWAVSDPIPERRMITIRLAEHLVKSDFLAEWSSLGGYLPTRPSSLAAWKDQSRQALASQIIPAAQIQPPNDVMAILGPVLQEATIQVLKDQVEPNLAAQEAVKKITTP